MKKLFMLLSVTFLFGCSDRNRNEIATLENYYLSDEACAFIFYEVEGAPPLEIKDRTINYHFDERNYITTSSSYDFGWATEESSGFRHQNFYRADGSAIPMGEEPQTYNGGKTIDNIERSYEFIHVDSKQGCFPSFKEIYRKN